MATMADEDENCFVKFTENIKSAILPYISHSLGDHQSHKIKVVKRNKDLGSGDLLIIIPEAQGLASRTATATATASESVSGAIATEQEVHPMDKLACENWKLPPPFSIREYKLQKNEYLTLHLERSCVFQHVISHVLSRGCEYGRSSKQQSPSAPHALVHCCALGQCETWPEFSLHHLRSFLLSEHITALLKANGYKVHQVQYDIQLRTRQLLQDLGVSCTSFISDSSQRNNELSAICDEFLKFYNDKSRHLEIIKQDCTKNDASNGVELNHMDEFTSTEKVVVLNLRDFITDTKLSCDKQGFDGNLRTADFSASSDHLHDASILEWQRRQMPSDCRPIVVHVMLHEKEFYQQQVDVGWRMTDPPLHTNMQQVHIGHGQVCSRSAHIPVCKPADLLKLRKEQMRQAAILKYGETVQGEGWENTISALTVAGMKLELLTTSCRQMVKLEMPSSEADGCLSPQDNRGGVFVMYNCARLSTLFHNFTTAVQQGIYPPMPDLKDVDFSLLKEDEEWMLLYNYILPYPGMVKETIVDIHHKKLRPNILTHKISHFLQDLSRDLSTYYSRIHVLGEPRPHLMGVMYARLSLLTATQTVLHNALALLGIEPLKQL